MNREYLIAIIGVTMIGLGLLCNDWLPTGLFEQVGSIGNLDRRNALRAFSILGPLLGIILVLLRQRIARNLLNLSILAISLMLSLAVFVAIDIALSLRAVAANNEARAMIDVHVPDKLLGWRPSPGANALHRENGSFEVRYEIDEQSFKRVDNRGIASRRVFIFGDSYTFGHGVHNDDTYANILAADYLADDVHVFNLGVMGYGLVQMYGRFLEIEAQLRAGDLVVFAPTSQDLRRNLKDFTFPSKLLFADRLDLGQTYPYYDDGQIQGIEIATSWNKLTALLFNGRWTKKIFRFIHSAVQSPPTTSEALDMMARVRRSTSARSAEFVLFFLPQTKERRKREYEEDVRFFDYEDVMEFFPTAADDLFALRFAIDSHWNRAGHEIAARAVATRLLELGLLSEDQFQPTAAVRAVRK